MYGVWFFVFFGCFISKKIKLHTYTETRILKYEDYSKNDILEDVCLAIKQILNVFDSDLELGIINDKIHCKFIASSKDGKFKNVEMAILLQPNENSLKIELTSSFLPIKDNGPNYYPNDIDNLEFDQTLVRDSILIYEGDSQHKSIPVGSSVNISKFWDGIIFQLKAYIRKKTSKNCIN